MPQPETPVFELVRKGDTWSQAGPPSAMLGHEVSGGGRSKPEGVFFKWIWDGHALRAEVDRYGFHPAFIADLPDRFLISPAIQSLLDAGVPADLDHEALAVFLRVGFFVGDDTAFRAIRAVPPGAVVRWADGKHAIDGQRPVPKPQDVSRSDAIDIYADLFSEAVRRRPPIGGQAICPLSGGRDSRHILLELMEQGVRPVCLTARHIPPRGDGDLATARALAERLGLRHEEVDPPQDVFEAVSRMHGLLGCLSDEHAWFLSVRAALDEIGDACVYDGIAGDVLSAGLFMSDRRRAFLERGKVEDFCVDVLGPWRSTLGIAKAEAGLDLLLGDGFAELVTREAALTRLEREVREHLSAPNPVASFFFWNRTRREVALAPYGMLAQEGRVVYAPFLDATLFDFLQGLPAEYVVDKSLHTEVLHRRFPAVADVPFSGSSNDMASDAATVAQRRRFAARLGWSIFRDPGAFRNVDVGAVMPRLGKVLLGRDYALKLWWDPEVALYLRDLNRMAARPEA